MKLQARLALSMALAAAISILVMATAFWVLSARQKHESLDNSLLRVVQEPAAVRDLVTGPPNEDGERPATREGSDEPARAPDIAGLEPEFALSTFSRVRVTIRDEVRVDEGLPPVDLSVLGDPYISTVEVNEVRYRMAAAGIGPDGVTGTLQVAIDVEDIEESIDVLRRQIVLGSLAGIALAAFLGFLVARRLAAPITEIAAATQSLATQRELPPRLNDARTDEVGDLARAFNNLLEALELSRNQQERLVADASHELRAPLASLRLKIDLLDADPDLDAVQQRELLASAATEVSQLTDLATELVDLATDPGGDRELPIFQSLPHLVSEVTERLELRTRRPVEVLSDDDEAEILIYPRMVRRAVSNIIDNAMKYSPSNTPVTVTVDGGRVEVRNVGEGILDEDRPHIFDRFFRSASTRAQPGNGIGLAIVKRVAEMHGGDVWAENIDNPAGVVVGFSLVGVTQESEDGATIDLTEIDLRDPIAAQNRDSVL